MSIVVEDGTGLASAETYETVVEFKAYCDARGVSYPADSVIEQKMREASGYMVGNLRDRWKGYRQTRTQVLDWPRNSVEIDDVGGGYGSAPYYLATNIVPAEVKAAHIELTIRAIAGTLNPDIKRRKDRVKLGPLEINYAPDAPIQTQFPTVFATIGFLLKANGGAMVKLVRS